LKKINVGKDLASWVGMNFEELNHPKVESLVSFFEVSFI